MNSIRLIVFFFLLHSCTAVRQLSSQKIKENEGCANANFDYKSILLDVEVDSVKTKFMLDTGSGLSVLIDSTVVTDFKNKEFGFLGSAKGADRKKIKNRFFTTKLRSELFESEKKALAYINLPSAPCSPVKRNYTGILGLDVFFNEEFLLQLDFTNKQVCNINPKQFSNLVRQYDYKLVKSSCKKNQIFVWLNIEGHEFPFKMDTGYSGSIVMPYTEELSFKNTDKVEYVGSLFQTISSFTNGSEEVYSKMPVFFGGELINTKLNVSTTIKAQNIGIDFIKGFDWLIDYNNNKVYVKRNQSKIESTFSRKVSYYAKVQDEKLVVAVKEKSQTRYQLGDQITSVNRHKVLPENICQMMDLLNKTEDWSTLTLDVISAQK